LNKSTLYKIKKLLSPSEQRTAFLLLFFMLIGMGLETLGVGLIIPAIQLMMLSDTLVKNENFTTLLAYFGNPSQNTLIVTGMLTLVAVYLIKAVFLAFLSIKQMKFAYGVQSRLSHQIFKTYILQPYTFHLQRNSAQLIRNTVGEVDIFTGNAMLPYMNLLTEGLVLTGLAGMLLFVEPLVACISILLLGAASWTFHKITRTRILNWGKKRQYHEAFRIQHLQQGLGGAKDVKLLGRESEFLKKYQIHNREAARMQQYKTTLQQMPRLWLELLAVSGVAIVVLTMILQKKDVTTIIPTMGLFVAAAFRMMPSLNRILAALQSLRFGLPVIQRLYEEINLTIPENQELLRKPLPQFQHDIKLQNLSYTYEKSERPALKDVSITIKKGESIGFIGPSGAGKSTLVDTILGLLPPTEGKIQVDNRDIQINLREWQSQIGYVPQSIYLTDDTLRNNIAFGIPEEEINNEAVFKAVKSAQLEEFINALPNGINSVVGERGVRLSGGQRQRIGIARALYHNPSVLVLDEATSALDVRTEQGVMEAITALKGDKTILIVAHRISTVEGCDRLYRLNDSYLIEEGTPDFVLSKETRRTYVS